VRVKGKEKAVFHVTDVVGTRFPAGRLTRVLAGPGGPVEPDHFVMGHVTVYPGGSVPGHTHEQEEIYAIVSGQGTMELGEDETPVRAGSFVAIEPGQWHSLRNTSQEDLVMIFCYAPKGIVDHWQQELESQREDE
jgi:mannose-6-phosphate isomerase-like protein (cupin superfamily)